LGAYGPLDLRIWEKYTKNKKIKKKIKDVKIVFSRVLKDFENQKITKAELSYLLEKIGISEGRRECFYQEHELYKYFHRIPTISEIIVFLIFNPQKLEERFNTQLSKILEFEKNLNLELVEFLPKLSLQFHRKILEDFTRKRSFKFLIKPESLLLLKKPKSIQVVKASLAIGKKLFCKESGGFYKFKYLISSILCPKRPAQTLSTSLASKPAMSLPRGG